VHKSSLEIGAALLSQHLDSRALRSYRVSVATSGMTVLRGVVMSLTTFVNRIGQ